MVSAAPPLAQRSAGSEDAPAGFAQALAPWSFAFPRDHGPHPQFRQEWWYVSGNLDAGSGERLGFELTFFRFALQPESGLAPEPAGPGSRAPHSEPGHCARNRARAA